MFHLVTFNMYPDRSGFTVCMCVFHSHIFTVIKYSCFIYIVSDWPISYKYEEYLTVHSNSFQLRVWRLSPRLSGRGVAQSLCATCHGLCRICTEYLGNWDSMLQWALAPEKDDACPLKKRADIVDGETYVCSNCWNVRQWPFLCLNNFLKCTYSASTPWKRQHHRLSTVWCPVAMRPLWVQPWVPSCDQYNSAYYIPSHRHGLFRQRVTS